MKSDISRQLKRMLQLVEQLKRGEYPKEVIEWTCESKDLSAVDKDALAAETSQYLRDNAGKVPDITAAALGNVPFTYYSALVGADIRAMIKAED